jgi:hypothetical protein
LIHVNQQFHSEQAAAGQNTVPGELLQKSRERSAMLFSPRDDLAARSWNEHAAILRAIIEGDERAAAKLAAERVMRAGADFVIGLNADVEIPHLPTKGGTKQRAALPRVLATAHRQSKQERIAAKTRTRGVQEPTNRKRNPVGKTKPGTRR